MDTLLTYMLGYIQQSYKKAVKSLKAVEIKILIVINKSM